VSWLVNRERFGQYVPEADVLSVTFSDNATLYLIDKDKDNLKLVSTLSMSGFEPKRVHNVNTSETTVEASLQCLGVQGFKIQKVPLLSLLLQTFIDSPIVKLTKHNDKPWLHTRLYDNKAVSYVWDTREIVETLDLDQTLKLGEDFEFVNDDLNMPLHVKTK
jgi:hypothetical protein